MATRVAYLLEEYPKLTETFVGVECSFLSKHPLVCICSLSKVKDEKALKRARNDGTLHITHYPHQILRNNLRVLVTRPYRYLRGLLLTAIYSPNKILAFLRAFSFIPLLESRRVEHLHTHFATFASTATWTIANFLGISFSFTIHATGLFSKRNRDILLGKKLEEAVFVVTISNYNKRYLKEQYSVEADKIKVIHAGIDVDNCYFEPRAKGKEDNIFALGRLVEKKGMHHLIKAVAILRERGINTRVQIIGNGPWEKKLRKLICSLGTKYIDIVTEASDDTVKKTFKNATLFVLPCMVAKDGDRDGIPVSLMEAMASGTLVISTNISGIPELVVSGKTGLLVAPGNSEALAEAIEKLLNDTNLYTRIAQEARRKVLAEFNGRKNAEVLAQLFREHT